MRYVFKVIVLISLIAGPSGALALELKPVTTASRTSFSYEIAPAGDGETAPYPTVYLGYERQMVSGILRGRGDFNAALNFGYSPRGLSFMLRVHDDDIIEDSPGENDAFALVLSLEGYSDRKIYWESSGKREKGLYGEGHVRVEEKSVQDRIYHISVPWGSWPLLQYRPYSLQLWAYDRDSWGSKTLRLGDVPLELVLNPPLPGEGPVVAAGRFYLREGDSLILYGELFSRREETRQAVFRVNGREIKSPLMVREGRTPFKLVLSSGEWKEHNLLEWDAPEGGVSQTFDVVKVKDDYIPVQSDEDILKNAFLKRHVLLRHGRLFYTPYEFFYHPGPEDSCRWIITGSYEKAAVLLKTAEEGYRGNLYIYVPPRERAAPLAYDFNFFWKETAADDLFLEGETGRAFLEMIKNGPASYRPSLHLVRIEDPGSFLYDPEIDSLRSYQVTLWEGRETRGISYPDFFRIKPLPDNNEIRAFFSEADKSAGEDAPLFLRSTALTHNRLGEMEIYELLHYDISFFSASLDTSREAPEIYTENIRYFTYPVGEETASLFINGKAYPAFPGELNRFSLDEKNDIWNVFVSESIALPGIKDFFSGSVRAADEETARKMKQLTGYEPPVGRGKRLLFWGPDLSADLESSFNILKNDEEITTMNGNKIRLDEPFLLLFESEEGLLLWMTADPSGLFSAPSNYIVFDSAGKIIRLGGVMPR